MTYMLGAITLSIKVSRILPFIKLKSVDMSLIGLSPVGDKLIIEVGKD